MMTMIKEEVDVDLEETLTALKAEADGATEDAMIATVSTTGTIPTARTTTTMNKIHHKQPSNISPKILKAEQKIREFLL